MASLLDEGPVRWLGEGMEAASGMDESLSSARAATVDSTLR